MVALLSHKHPCSSLLSLLFVLFLKNTNNKNAGVLACDIGPDALTEFFGKSIPQTCIDVPYDGDGSTTKTVKRCYYTYVPDSCKSVTATGDGEKNKELFLPLVLDSHGVGGCPLLSAQYTGWKEKAEEECFVLVWPVGFVSDEYLISPCWNLPGYLSDGNDVTTVPCCCFKEEDEADFKPPDKEPNDPLFLKMTIDAVIKDFENEDPPEAQQQQSTDPVKISIDRSRVYMAGHSNGCMASLSVAALYSDSIAAVCCHAGSLVTGFPEDEYVPVPVWMTHGMKDGTIPYEGETIIDMMVFGSYGFWPLETIVEYVANSNGCVDEEAIDLYNNTNSGVDDDSSSSNATSAGIVYKRTNCENNANVELVALFEAGHFPYALLPVNGGDAAVNSNNLPLFASFGDSPVEIDTTAMAWEFCSSHVNARIEEEQQQQQKEKEHHQETQASPEKSPAEGASPETSSSEKASPETSSAAASADHRSTMLYLYSSYGIGFLAWALLGFNLGAV
mmetsp:Transcript_24579/g.54110  ORF Transcript_24579/g.54110 Transcript_24579/m.54110 type:complete len:504 (-) Transcript_24579:258-1769(-)